MTRIVNAFKVRQAVISDAPALLQMMTKLAEFESYLDQFKVSHEDLIERGFKESDTNQFTAIIAEDTELIGYAVVYTIPFTYDLKPTLVLKELYVEESARGRGVGRQLFQYVIDHAKSIGCGRIKFEVLPSNNKAMCFYGSFGAKHDSRWQNWILQL